MNACYGVVELNPSYLGYSSWMSSSSLVIELNAHKMLCISSETISRWEALEKSLKQRINYCDSGLPSQMLDLRKDPPPIPVLDALIKDVKFHKTFDKALWSLFLCHTTGIFFQIRISIIKHPKIQIPLLFVMSSQ